MEYSHYILGEKRDQQECKDTDSSYALPSEISYPSYHKKKPVRLENR